MEIVSGHPRTARRRSPESSLALIPRHRGERPSPAPPPKRIADRDKMAHGSAIPAQRSSIHRQFQLRALQLSSAALRLCGLELTLGSWLLGRHQVSEREPAWDPDFQILDALGTSVVVFVAGKSDDPALGEHADGPVTFFCWLYRLAQPPQPIHANPYNVRPSTTHAKLPRAVWLVSIVGCLTVPVPYAGDLGQRCTTAVVG